MPRTLGHLDLASVFPTRKAEVKPHIVAVVTQKNDSFDQVKSALETVGVSVSKAEEPKKEDGTADGTVAFMQGDANLEGEMTVVRLSEDVAMVCKGFRPYNMDVEVTAGTTFADVCKAQGFYPGVGTMVDVLRSSVLSLAEKSDDPAAAAKSIRKMFSEAAEYAASMVSALPSVAFKMELMDIARKEETTDEKTPEQLADEQAAALEVMKADESLPESVEKADLKKVPAGVEPKTWLAMDDAAKKAWWADKLKAKEMPAKKEEGKEGETKPAQTLPVVAGPSADEIATIVAKAMDAAIKPLSEQLGEVKKSVSEQSVSLKDIGARVEKAEEALEGSIVLGSEGGDQATSTKKNEGAYQGQEIDTGFGRTRRLAGGRSGR